MLVVIDLGNLRSRIQEIERFAMTRREDSCVELFAHYPRRAAATLVAIGICLGLVGPAGACDPSWWSISRPTSCIEVLHGNSDSQFVLQNGCDEQLRLESRNPVRGNFVPMDLEPGATADLVLAEAPNDGAVETFTYRVGEESAEIRFEYDKNVCPSEEGCGIARAGSDPAALWLGGLGLLALLLVRGRRPVAHCSDA
jgi:hypothetical protein